MYEMEDFYKAEKLIELGHPETNLDKLAQKIYEKRIKDAGKSDPYKHANE
jgi:hypothetical protein